MTPSKERIRELLRPYRVELTSCAIWQIETYLALLARWNEKINLTAIREPELAVTRHFGESLFLVREERLEGRLLDIGSGAGFPGLALKIARPLLDVTLLEPVGKKRAFLLEAARVCGMSRVAVRRERLEDFEAPAGSFDAVTMRAVGNLPAVIEAVKPLLAESGRLYLWLSRKQSRELRTRDLGYEWLRQIRVPGSDELVVLAGSKAAFHVEHPPEEPEANPGTPEQGST